MNDEKVALRLATVIRAPWKCLPRREGWPMERWQAEAVLWQLKQWRASAPAVVMTNTPKPEPQTLPPPRPPIPPRPPVENPDDLIIRGDIEFNPHNRVVVFKGGPVYLSQREFDLFSFLITNAGVILSVEKILENVWKDSTPGRNTVASYVNYLNKKLPGVVQNRRGVGYLID